MLITSQVATKDPVATTRGTDLVTMIEMRNPFKSPFAAIFSAEVLLNSKRIAPYLLMMLFAANAILWWAWGSAVRSGWATNSDFYIVRNLKGFAFLLGLPIFNAVIMGDPVIRDFRFGIDPLLFSKPINRAEYLFGKFLGNFFVLVSCQLAFPLTLLVLQAFRTSEMIVQPVRVSPYFKHFFFFRGYAALNVGSPLLYRRNAYPQQQDRLRLSSLFLSAVHYVRGLNDKGPDSGYERPARSFSA